MSPTPLLPDIPLSECVEPVKPACSPQELRIIEPVRNQVELVCRDLDSTLPDEHPARAIWAFLDRLALTAFYQQIRVFCDGPGRPTTDPTVLLALWVYATAEGIGSARRLAALCETHDVYRWICGGVPINYHMLSDVRVAHQAALDALMTDILTAMMAEDLVHLQRVAQDGMRVRASAGAASFRRERTLATLREEAAAQVDRLSQVVHAADETKREQAARLRAARERQERIDAALAQLPQVRAIKKTAQEKDEARVSTTDADARVMTRGDGGFRPAFNVQLATDTNSQTMVGVAVVPSGSDAHEAVPMVAHVEERIGQKPSEYLVDGGCANQTTVEHRAASQITLYAPVRKPKAADRNPHLPLPTDSEPVAAWRIRMGDTQAKAIYKERAATAECVNATCRALYGMQQFRVRGLAKVTCVVLLTAITHNLLRWMSLMGPLT